MYIHATFVRPLFFYLTLLRQTVEQEATKRYTQRKLLITLKKNEEINNLQQRK